MKSFLLIICLAFTFHAGEAFQKLGVLKGLWKMETKRGVLYEEWTSLNEHELSGKSYKIREKDTLPLENISLKLMEGSVFYIPIVQNQHNKEPVPFKMTGYVNDTYTFENKNHDFPQRIIYRFVGQDSLVARIEGTYNGKEESWEYYYSRVQNNRH